MTELHRLGDIVTVDTEYKIGEQRITYTYSELSEKILFGDKIFGINEFYVSLGPEKPAIFPSFKAKVDIAGDYELSLVEKILQPLSPILCIKGSAGSGKTTTIKYVLENFIERVRYETDVDDKEKLILMLDFNELFLGLDTANITLYELMSTICHQLWKKCRDYLDLNREFNLFWTYLLDLSDNDNFVESVTGELLNWYPLWCEVSTTDEFELKKREGIKENIKSKNIIWYFKYLLLIWRYLAQTQFLVSQNRGVIVFDNLESLSTDTQRNLIRVIISSAHLQGPTFILPLRTETFERHGLNDILVDVISHEGPEPYQVVLNRLGR